MSGFAHLLPQRLKSMLHKVTYFTDKPVLIGSKQPKNLKKTENFLFNFLNFQTKINFEKNFC